MLNIVIVSGSKEVVAMRTAKTAAIVQRARRAPTESDSGEEVDVARIEPLLGGGGRGAEVGDGEHVNFERMCVVMRKQAAVARCSTYSWCE